MTNMLPKTKVGGSLLLDIPRAEGIYTDFTTVHIIIIYSDDDVIMCHYTTKLQ